jgi:hypothetical protein
MKAWAGYNPLYEQCLHFPVLPLIQNQPNKGLRLSHLVPDESTPEDP